MAHTRIKICGITRLEDALAIQSAGCDAIGFVLWDGSSRHIERGAAAEITRALTAPLMKVGVFVSPTVAEVSDAANEVGLDAAQLCGPLPNDDWEPLSQRLRLIRAIGVKDDAPIQWESIPGVGDYMVDTYDGRSHGGTGRTFAWSRVAGQDDQYRIWLAGGLNPTNITEAIRVVAPFAVDVSSGVETAPGIKSVELIGQFVAAVRAADRANQ